jgi:hypothetical protein
VISIGFVSELQRFSALFIPGNVKIAIDTWIIKNNTGKEMLTIMGWAFPADKPMPEMQKYIILSSDSPGYIFSTATVTRPDVTSTYSHLNRDLNNSGFVAVIPCDSLTPGSYRVGVGLKDADVSIMKLSDTVIEIDGGQS